MRNAEIFCGRDRDGRHQVLECDRHRVKVDTMATGDQELPLYFDGTRGKPGHKPTAGKEEEDDERDRAD